MERWNVGTLECAFHSIIPSIHQFSVFLGTPFQPAKRPFKGVATRCFIRFPRRDVIEGHRDIGAERPLYLDGPLRSEQTSAAVDVALELHAFFVDASESFE